VGLRSDAAAHGVGSPGNKEKWGLLVCEAEPDLPKELLNAIEREIVFLNQNPPDVKMRKDNVSGAIVATNIEAEPVKAEKIALSNHIQELRQNFEKDCRKLVMKSEVAKAKKNLLTEDQRLVNEAERMWARGEGERRNINDLHIVAARRIGREYPWAYIPQVLTDCPGCGGKIKENILSCSHCAGWLDEGIEKLRAMPPKERAMKMYPERYAEPMTPKATKQPHA